MKNKQMRLAFYKAFQPKATWIDNTVALASFGRYSHVELVFPDTCFSSSFRDKGARFKKIDISTNRWDVIDLHPSIDSLTLIKEAQKYTGYKYDYLGALFSITPFCIQQNNKIFCSEIIVNLLNNYSIYNFKDGCTYNPSELYKAIIY